MVDRCWWAGTDKMYNDYHDLEWGVPVHDDRILFEFLTLEGAQAGLSWRTILERRENYRLAFDNYDYKKIAQYSEKKVEELRNNAEQIAKEHGIKIQFVRKRHIRKEKIIEKVIKARGEHPGLAHPLCGTGEPRLTLLVKPRQGCVDDIPWRCL